MYFQCGFFNFCDRKACYLLPPKSNVLLINLSYGPNQFDPVLDIVTLILTFTLAITSIGRARKSSEVGGGGPAPGLPTGTPDR